MDIDYSEYRPDEYDIYVAARSSNRFVKLNHFANSACFNSESKTFEIQVDNRPESAGLIYFEQAKAEAERNGVEFDESEWFDSVDDSPEDFEESKMYYKKMKSKYNLFAKDAFGFETDAPDELESDCINVLSGNTVRLKYGEGILDFIYTDFKTPMDVLIGKETSEVRILRALFEEPDEDIKVHNFEEKYLLTHEKYVDTISKIKEVIYSSLYSAVCPPVFKGYNIHALRHYLNYIIVLQKEYKELVEFCYDEDFYPELLADKYPSERYLIYKQIHHLPIKSKRVEELSIGRKVASGTEMPYGMEKTELIKCMTSIGGKPTEEQKRFAEKYNYPIGQVKLLSEIPFFMNISYKFGTIAEILELEFTKMFEQNVRFRKCKRCGRYFIMKGNYDTNYCDRVAEGETRNCQELAALEKYKAKTADNKAVAIYNKYYKRYSARVKVRQIKEADFKKWKYQALTMRDDCTDGVITPEEYTEWMENYFPNRKPKK